MDKYIIALADTGKLEANWVYRVVEETNTSYIVVEEFTGPGIVKFEAKKTEAIAEISKEQYGKLESLLEEDGFEDYLFNIMDEKKAQL